MSDDAEKLISQYRDQRRICPMPIKWKDLYLILNRGRERADWAAIPLILGGWSASDEAKAERFAEHIRWADQHGKLSEVGEFLAGLFDEDWYSDG